MDRSSAAGSGRADAAHSGWMRRDRLSAATGWQRGRHVSTTRRRPAGVGRRRNRTELSAMGNGCRTGTTRHASGGPRPCIAAGGAISGVHPKDEDDVVRNLRGHAKSAAAAAYTPRRARSTCSWVVTPRRCNMTKETRSWRSRSASRLGARRATAGSSDKCYNANGGNSPSVSERRNRPSRRLKCA